VTVAASAIAPVPEALAQEPGPRTERGWLGIVMDEKPGGKVMVKEVLHRSPAHKAGLRTGDRLKSVGGSDVSTARETARAVGKHAAGSTIRLVVVRSGKEHTKTARLEAFPSGEALLRMQHVGKSAPPLRGLRSVMGTGGPTSNDFRGKVVVLDFWASWCIACRVTAMHLNRWHDRYADRGLAVLGVAGQSPEAAAKGTRRFQIRYPTCADPDMETSSAFHVRELPSVIIIDRRGVVRGVATGYDRKRMRELEALVRRLLAQPVPSSP